MNSSPAQVHLVAMGVHFAWLALSVLLFRASARGMLIEGDGSPAQSIFVIGALTSAAAAFVCFLRAGTSLAVLLGTLAAR